MSNNIDEMKSVRALTSHAAEWGLASLLLGGILAVLAMLTLQINLQLYHGSRGLGTNELHLLKKMAMYGGFVPGIMAFLGAVFGARSVLFAAKHGQPSALGWAGLMMSLFALLLWIGAIADLLAVVSMLLRE